MMLSVPVFTALFATAAVAQSSIANLLVQDSDNGPDDLVVSLVNAGPSLTTYVMNCQPTLDADECGWGPGATFTVGSTTMDMILSEEDFTWSAHCSYSTISAANAVCTNVYGGSGANDPGTETADYDGGDNGYAPWAGITITAGLDAVAASTTGSGSASATGSSSGVVNTASTGASASAKDTTTGSVSGSVTGSATEQVTASSSKASSTSSSTSTGGAPHITAASFAMGGAAMLIAIAAL